MSEMGVAEASMSGRCPTCDRRPVLLEVDVTPPGWSGLNTEGIAKVIARLIGTEFVAAVLAERTRLVVKVGTRGGPRLDELFSATVAELREIATAAALDRDRQIASETVSSRGGSPILDPWPEWVREATREVPCADCGIYAMLTAPIERRVTCEGDMCEALYRCAKCDHLTRRGWWRSSDRVEIITARSSKDRL